MVEQLLSTDKGLDAVFRAFSDITRRDILKRVAKSPLSISALAEPYDMSFAGIAKHVDVLEKARLVAKYRVGKKQMVESVPRTIVKAIAQLESYKKMMQARFDALEALANKS